MIRIVIGSLASAVAMLIVALLFFATPLAHIAYHSLDDAHGAALQLTLAQHLPSTGTNTVPNPTTQAGAIAFGKGPVATIHYNMAGFSPSSGAAFLPGFIHMYIVALLIGAALLGFAGAVTSFGERARVVGIFAIAASAYIHLADPIWMHGDWTYAIYLFAADAAALAVGGIILARWFMPRAATLKST